MSSIEALRALQMRVEAATEDDGTLLVDAAAVLFDGGPTTGEAGRITPADDHFRRLVGAEAWIDAALYLVEQVLPGWGVSVAVTSDGMAQATLYPPQSPLRPVCYYADCPDGSRAMALLAALVAARL